LIVDFLIAIGMAFLWAFWIMIPAYIPNPAAALIGGGTPIDFGKCAKDGRRIFGDGKTWRGLIGGIIIGIIFGLIQIFLVGFFQWDFLPKHTIVTICALSTGALLGDLIKSYFKRRLGKERGAKWPIADMYDMVVGSLVLMVLALLVTGNIGWFAANFDSVWFLLGTFVAILILSPLLHRGTNIIGYLLGLKDVPW
jgi:CDP-2,3-bis-(O-geranylgeranyl)-sn-glycerol synthase